MRTVAPPSDIYEQKGVVLVRASRYFLTMGSYFSYVHVNSEGKVDTLNVDLGDSTLEVDGTLAEIFDSRDSWNSTFFELNQNMWKIEPNTASYFEVDDEFLTQSFFEIITNGITEPAKIEEEEVDTDWVEALPEEEFTDFIGLHLNYDVNFASRALIINGFIYGIFYNSGQTILIKMDPDSEFTTPYLETSIASLSYICWGSRTSGTDSFFLLQIETGDYFIFEWLDDRDNEFSWLPENLTINSAVIEFLNFIQTSGEVVNLSRAGMAAAIYDSINGANKEHFLEAHSELSEHDPYASAEHYYGLQEFEVDLNLYNVPTEIMREIVESELRELPNEIAQKITWGEYCFETALYAPPETFNESEWSVIRKYDSFSHHSIEDAYREYDAAASALENRTEEVAKARQLLGIKKDDLTYLLTKTNELIKNNPSNEIAYWEAYWVLRDDPSRERLKEAEIQRNLAEEIQNAVEKLHWPKDWKFNYAPVWLSLGGDALTADRWFKKGWTIETILFRQQLPSAWNGTLTERVRLLDAPERLDPFALY